ncbi:hypothetical protein [Dyadobacter pollutisoli]|uniref:Uncharacterized protein n=1 Tax=Dyadobacter pollutisoli TaxID=2910158 RepID=A0A9E8NAL0_9BACT|nr:hypothetical protein [Dyadobacter pollutisoli]WAC12398.1 hypothetical protein ON006_00255 [Dyadobacter pollutisoli]
MLFENEKSLINFLDNRINQQGKGEVTIICAGHFIILPDSENKHLIPGIFETGIETGMESAQNTIGIFPIYTWKIGCGILERTKKLGQSSKLSLLVNDWQLVPRDQERRAAEPNRFRSEFYDNFKALPDIYQKVFDQHNLNLDNDLYHSENDEFYLREVGLRDRFVRYINRLFKKQSKIAIASCSLNLDDCGNVLFKKEDESSYPLLRNGRTDCIGGIAQMIMDISDKLRKDRGHSSVNFINLLPRSCIKPVNVGSEFAIETLKKNKNQRVSVINIFFNGIGPLREADFYEIYGREVVGYEFNTK